MIENGNKYVHGAAAEKLEYNVYEENTVLKDKKKQRNNSKAKVKAVFTILFLFLLCFTVIFRYTQITELNYNIGKSEKLYSQLKDENSRLKVDIEKGMDLNNIREIAESKLGMQKPDKAQIVYVSVPKNNFSIVSDTYKDGGKKESTITSFLSRIGDFTRLLN